MAGRQEAIHSKKLEQALRSHERFPINLEWMVDVFKYKHISSLTTHLKRHFKMNVHYKRFAQEQNKRVWTYFITVDCFIGICEYVRHAARKKIANVWLRKVGIKGSTRRFARDYEEFPELSEEDDLIEEEVEEAEEDDLEYDYYNESMPCKRRRIDEDDEEFECEEEEDDEERTYFQEMEEEEACVEYETDDTGYDSSSSLQYSPHSRSASLTVKASSYPFQGKKIVTYSAGNPYQRMRSSSGSDFSVGSPSSSAPSSPPSSPSSTGRSELTASTCSNLSNSGGIPVIIANTSISTPTVYAPNIAPTPSSPIPAPAASSVQTKATLPPPVAELAPPAEGLKEQVDWSYLHLRPNPHPLNTYDFPHKYVASLMLGSQYYSYPQVSQYGYMFAPTFLANCQGFYLPNVDPNGFTVRQSRDIENLHGELSNMSMDERYFDTNMFLSFPEEHHYQAYQSFSEDKGSFIH